MAQIIKKQNFQSNNPQKPTPIFPIIGFLLILAGIGLAFADLLVGTVVLGICGVLLLLVGSSRSRFDDSIKRAGDAGESATAHLISQLPQGYYGFQNLYVTYEGEQSEIDMVVVGKTGVFIIETKHLNGYVVGNYESRDWILHKTGRRGGEYSKEFYSPVKQVGTHVYRLAKFLRSNGVPVTVEAMVFFTHPNTRISVAGQQGRIPVYAGQPGANSLVHNIMSGTANLTTQQIHSICSLLNQCL